ncbi:MAG: hypothetical protein OEV94_05620 [Deltaproteobacteria bacterium]|nr:hypothetical protein [Deltaproteobacteria bacterium]
MSAPKPPLLILLETLAGQALGQNSSQKIPRITGVRLEPDGLRLQVTAKLPGALKASHLTLHLVIRYADARETRFWVDPQIDGLGGWVAKAGLTLMPEFLLKELVERLGGGGFSWEGDVLILNHEDFLARITKNNK